MPPQAHVGGPLSWWAGIWVIRCQASQSALTRTLSSTREAAPHEEHAGQVKPMRLNRRLNRERPRPVVSCSRPGTHVRFSPPSPTCATEHQPLCLVPVSSPVSAPICGWQPGIGNLRLPSSRFSCAKKFCDYNSDLQCFRVQFPKRRWVNRQDPVPFFWRRSVV